MTDYAPDAVPQLPADALREALGKADLDAAQALLDAHDRAVRQALGPDALPDPRQMQEWQHLADAHQALLDELSALRDHAADQIRMLQRHQRGAHAYLQAMG
ncbi:hypothetical protein [Thermomonas sp.]|uniref:hypothetical protein n=1 Tax=Thermomonas sp. TaxID=1971895 RepID=UPI0035B1A5B2